MRRVWFAPIAVALSVLALSVLALLAGCENDDTRFAITSGGGDVVVSQGVGTGSAFGQPYSIYVPPGYDGQPVPLLVAVHGSGGEPSQMISLFRALADSETFIILAPSYLFSDELLPVPNGSDTIGLVEAMVSEVEFYYSIDTDRRYLFGFSTGATWSYLYGLTYSEEFAAASAVAGGYSGPDPLDAQLTVATATRRIPFTLVHGVNDGIFPIENARVASDALQDAGHIAPLTEHNLGHGVPVTSEQAVWAFLSGFSL